ncbi:MAG: hypothetical protein ACLTYK_12855, partial [Hominisplanchenecus sp.]
DNSLLAVRDINHKYIVVGKNKRKRNKNSRDFAWNLCGCSLVVLFFSCGKSGSREKDGGDRKLCQSAVLNLHPL